MDETQRLSNLLRPYRTDAIQDATGVSRSNAHNWRNGRTLPETRFLPALAELLRIDLAELTRIVADDSTSRQARVVSRRVVA